MTDHRSKVPQRQGRYLCPRDGLRLKFGFHSCVSIGDRDEEHVDVWRCSRCGYTEYL